MSIISFVEALNLFNIEIKTLFSAQLLIVARESLYRWGFLTICSSVAIVMENLKFKKLLEFLEKSWTFGTGHGKVMAFGDLDQNFMAMSRVPPLLQTGVSTQ